MESSKLLAACAIGACTMVSGCAGAQERRVSMAPVAAAVAPDNCEEKNRNDVNYIKIAYRANGEPFSDPDACHVRPGSTLIWTLDHGVGTAFEILFDKDGGRTPDVDGRKDFPGRGPKGGALKAVIPVVKENPPGAEPRYRYSIVSNGKKVDPSVIIDP